MRSPECGGPNRDRTDDLTDANRTLSQLSYRPKCSNCHKNMPPLLNGKKHYTINSRIVKTDFFGKTKIFSCQLENDIVK